MSNDNYFEDEADISHLTPDDDAAPRAQDRRSMDSPSEPDNFDGVRDHDDGPEVLEWLEEQEKHDRRGRIPPVRWANDEDQPDFAHLMSAKDDGIVPDTTFKLTPDVLELLIEANSFRPDGPGHKFVFALRGGKLAGGKREVEDATSIEIIDGRPDHQNFKCTIGYYDRANRTITAYLASTVPNKKFMTNYYKTVNGIATYRTGSNIMPTGCYVFRKNAHSGGKVNPALRMTNPDSLKDDAITTVLRTKNDLSYTHGDFWHRTTPYDNVHCAYFTTKFSSAGCLTICGPKTGRGPWRSFQSELKKHPWDTRIDVLLLTGHDAAIAAKILQADRDDKDELVKKHLRRLRLGSQGPAVRALQIKLGYSGRSEYFGPSTRLKLVEFERQQSAKIKNSDAIYSFKDEQALGWKIFDATDTQLPPGPTPPGTPTTPQTPTPPAPAPGLIPDSLVIIAGKPGTQPSPDMKTLIVPGEGTWTVGPVPGKITFSPDARFHGTPHPITYRISNTAGGSATASISVTVLDVNKAPIIEDDTARTIQGKPVTITVLTNDTDTDGIIVPATVRLVSILAGSAPTADGKTLGVPGKGTWVVDPESGDIRFSPSGDFTGTVQTKYQVSDEDGATGNGTITVTVTPIIKPPVIGDDTAETTSGTPVTIDVLANDNSGLPIPQPPVTPQPPGGTTDPTDPNTTPTPPVPTNPPVTPLPDGPPITGVVTMTDEQLRRFAPRAKDKYLEALVAHSTQTLTNYGINANPMRLCHFLAQIGHESGGFTIDRESLYYTTAKRIQKVWPSRFRTLNYAQKFVRNEEKLAAEVYDGRMRDLGNSQPGDGFKYRGRGLIQITGRANYKDMGKKIKVDLEGSPDLATDGLTALKIAARTWYDRTRGGRTMNELADDNKIDVITLRINGGHTNISQRRHEFQRAWKIWGNGDAPQTIKNPDIIERGQKGERVKKLQRLLVQKGYFPADEKIDGIFGGQTLKTVMRFQATHNENATGINRLNVNGIVDKKTMTALKTAPDARRGLVRPRSARDPRALGSRQPRAQMRRARRRAYPPAQAPNAIDTTTSLMRLIAVGLAVSALAVLCISGLDYKPNAHATISNDFGSHALKSLALFALALAVFGASWWRIRKTRNPEIATTNGNAKNPAGHTQNYPAPNRPQYETDNDFAFENAQGYDPELDPELDPDYEDASHRSPAPSSPSTPIPSQQDPALEDPSHYLPVKGAQIPLSELNIDESLFIDPQPIRHAPGLPEDIDASGGINPDEEAPPALTPEGTLETPAGQPSRDITGASTRSMPVPFAVTPSEVNLVLIKMFGGDNNLSGQVENDLQEITAGILSGNGSQAMIALADLENAPASVIEINAQGVRRTIENLGEIDTGDPKTLAHFLSRALVSYPNARKAIGFWDHGTGVFDEFDPNEVILTRSHRALTGTRSRPARRLFIPADKREVLRERADTRGMLHDNSGGLLTNVEAGRMLAAAFARARQHEPIDLIYSDTCLNGMIEVLEELGDYAHCIVASSDTEPGAGWDYEQWIHATAREFPQTPQHWGQRAVRAFSTRYANQPDEHPCTLAAFDANNNITESFAQLVSAATDADLPGWWLLSHIRGQTQPYDNRDAYDLLDFSAKLVQAANGDANQPQIATAAANLDIACRNARIDFTRHGHQVTESQGLAFWFPSNRRSMQSDIETYRRLKFAQTTGWADYLESNYTGITS